MHELKRLTSEYVEEEDRFRLAGEAGDELPVVLWLTHRLLERLLPHLWKWLEREGQDLLRADVLQGMAQQKAQSQMGPQAAVRAGADSLHWLVTRIDLDCSDESVRIRFCGAEQQEASFSMSRQVLRQWLAIVHQGYRKAGWPLEGWPEWMTEVVTPGRISGTTLH